MLSLYELKTAIYMLKGRLKAQGKHYYDWNSVSGSMNIKQPEFFFKKILRPKK